MENHNWTDNEERRGSWISCNRHENWLDASRADTAGVTRQQDSSLVVCAEGKWLEQELINVGRGSIVLGAEFYANHTV